jgi:hypothetical protein
MELETILDIGGFVGAWLLVAGPLQQAAMELRQEDARVQRIHAVHAAVPAPRPVSVWWWLLPPVKVVLDRRRGARHKQAFFERLEHEDAEAVLEYLNAANAWLFVSGGACLLAFKETLNLVERFEAPTWAFWAGCVVLPLACIGNVIVRTKRTQQLTEWHSHLGDGAPEP